MTDNSVKTEYSVALGYFDGLHKAHRQVLERTLATARERGLTPAVLLFDEHPRTVISGGAVPSLLQREKRDEMLREMGFTLLFVSFRSIKDMSPGEFFKEILCEKFPSKALHCGYNYNFGKRAEGNTKILSELCEKSGVSLAICPEITLDGESISSTRIRKAVEQGDITSANEMLGYPFCFASPVFSGDKRGRLLGAPTINQYLPRELAVPRFGVYASKVYFDGKEYIGVTNIGSRPTFDGGSVRSETFIVDFSGDLYGRSVDVELYAFIRDEQKFPDANSLKAQIAKDVEAAKRQFGILNSEFGDRKN